MFIQPWNGWYHVTVHVYGSWLRGDPRGWRARHHREHVIGDYKNPPPSEMYDHLFELSKKLMKRDAVHIDLELREFVLCAVVERLQRERIEVLVASLDGTHLHILARFPDGNVNHYVGLAKKHASHLVRQEGLRSEEGGLWAKRGHPEPIKNEIHRERCVDYIANHAKRGAVVWRADIG